jgi:uncharacterized metal-binding protein
LFLGNCLAKGSLQKFRIMASGNTHDRITQLCLPLVAGGGLLLSRSWELTLLLGGSFLFSGLMFGPDLDIHSNQSMRWGYFQWLWIPYRRLVPHRSPFSHGPIIGTLGRILYVLLLIGLCALAIKFLGRAIGQNTWNAHQLEMSLRNWMVRHVAQLWTIFIGLELGAMTHYVADWISSGLKKGRKPSSARKKKANLS